MKTHVLFVHDNSFNELADLVMPFWKEYCQRHGYNLTVDSTENEEPQFHYSFHKMRRVLAYLKYHDPAELLILDVDMLPTNMTLSLHDVVGSDYSAITMTRDINGLNNGATLLRYDTPVCRNWLKLIIALRSVTTSELHAMWLLDDVYKDYTRVLPHANFNSIPYHLYEYGLRKEEDGQWSEGHLLCHLPGMSNAKRMEIFTQMIPLIKR